VTISTRALWPYADEANETYTFPIEEFPTKADVISWFVATEGDVDEDDRHTEDSIAGPSPTLVHDHDEDYLCTGADCPLSRTIDCWNCDW